MGTANPGSTPLHSITKRFHLHGRPHPAVSRCQETSLLIWMRRGAPPHPSPRRSAVAILTHSPSAAGRMHPLLAARLTAATAARIEEQGKEVAACPGGLAGAFLQWVPLPRGVAGVYPRVGGSGWGYSYAASLQGSAWASSTGANLYTRAPGWLPGNPSRARKDLLLPVSLLLGHLLLLQTLPGREMLIVHLRPTSAERPRRCDARAALLQGGSGEKSLPTPAQPPRGKAFRIPGSITSM